MVSLNPDYPEVIPARACPIVSVVVRRIQLVKAMTNEERQALVKKANLIVRKYTLILERGLVIMDEDYLPVSKDALRNCIEFMAIDAINHPEEHIENEVGILRNLYIGVSDFQKIDQDDRLIVEYINTSERMRPYRRPGMIAGNETKSRPDYRLMSEFSFKYMQRSCVESENNMPKF